MTTSAQLTEKFSKMDDAERIDFFKAVEAEPTFPNTVRAAAHEAVRQLELLHRVRQERAANA